MKRLKETRHLRPLLISLFSFSLGCMITINFTPIDKTCIVDNTDREYNIMKNSKLRNPELIILILSAPKNLEKRSTIRETWLRTYNGLESKNFRFKHYFVVGSLGLNHDEVLHLSDEQSEFGDILVLPLHDSYKNLTLKVMKSLEWLDEQYVYGLEFKYVLKCDDDSFVNLPQLLIEIPKLESTLKVSNLYIPLNLPPEKLNQFITTNLQSNSVALENISIYWGYFNGNAQIKQMGKWAEPHWITCDKYSPYALGGGYILSKNVVTFISQNAPFLRTFNSEDISMGLWLAPLNNLLRVHDIRFDTEWVTRGCKNFHLVSHNLSPDEMRAMYDNLVSNKQLCVREEEKRAYYLYDWEAPPSQCCRT